MGILDYIFGKKNTINHENDIGDGGYSGYEPPEKEGDLTSGIGSVITDAARTTINQSSFGSGGQAIINGASKAGKVSSNIMTSPNESDSKVVVDSNENDQGDSGFTMHDRSYYTNMHSKDPISDQLVDQYGDQFGEPEHKSITIEAIRKFGPKVNLFVHEVFGDWQGYKDSLIGSWKDANKRYEERTKTDKENDKIKLEAIIEYIMKEKDLTAGDFTDVDPKVHKDMIQYMNQKISNGEVPLTEELNSKYRGYLERNGGLVGPSAKASDLNFNLQPVGTKSRPSVPHPSEVGKEKPMTNKALDIIFHTGRMRQEEASAKKIADERNNAIGIPHRTIEAIHNMIPFRRTDQERKESIAFQDARDQRLQKEIGWNRYLKKQEQKSAAVGIIATLGTMGGGSLAYLAGATATGQGFGELIADTAEDTENLMKKNYSYKEALSASAIYNGVSFGLEKYLGKQGEKVGLEDATEIMVSEGVDSVNAKFNILEGIAYQIRSFSNPDERSKILQKSRNERFFSMMEKNKEWISNQSDERLDEQLVVLQKQIQANEEAGQESDVEIGLAFFNAILAAKARRKREKEEK